MNKEGLRNRKNFCLNNKELLELENSLFYYSTSVYNFG